MQIYGRILILKEEAMNSRESRGPTQKGENGGNTVIYHFYKVLKYSK